MRHITRLAVIASTLISFTLAQSEPTHIIKFKSFTGRAAAPDMLLSYHREFLTSVRQQRFASTNNTREAEDLNLIHIDLGESFSLVEGVFSDYAFLDYLYKQSSIEYVEPNQWYQSTAIVKRADDGENDEENEEKEENEENEENEEKEEKEERESKKTEKSVAKLPKKTRVKKGKPANWGLARINQHQKENFEEYSYDSLGGAGMNVYVLDTGVYVDHLDFGKRVLHSKNLVVYEDENDMGGHGTHVAAKIAGKEYGVSKAVTIQSVKVLNKQGAGSTSRLLKGIEHIIQVAKPGKSLINLSLTGPHSRLIDDALNEIALNYHIPVFVSAGNSGTDACFFTPSSNPNVFTVGAMDMQDQVARFSNVGECVNMYAPGVEIVSAYVGGNESSKSIDGTSMATPHVTAVAANLMSLQNFSTTHELYNTLKSMATKDLLGFDLQKSSSPNNNLLVYNSV